MHEFKNIVIFGATGAIGSSLIHLLKAHYRQATIHAVSRNFKDKLTGIIYHQINYSDELMIQSLAVELSQVTPIDLVIIATGMLHDSDIMPEKSIKEISADKFLKLYQVNTVLPSLIFKHFTPKLNSTQTSVIAALSARVGSVSDNRLGGWYSYRASKAALNMVIKNVAIETSRYNKKAIVVGLHPGTVDSALSYPFQRSVHKNKIFTPRQSAQYLLNQINKLTMNNTGKILAWDGQEIAP
ncbi:SDR family NAD(P)-dependent oxidoreductase [Cysteiniphilum sp. 6C5]|uniref:SDR family NAD(P)-dependent oxidoreductase n=1 Tax=unclassified Cysteiniphilum TaxID=2610889 RepID=UPI003F8463B6